MAYTYFEESQDSKAATVLCGKGRKYQVDLPGLQLLAAPTSEDTFHDKRLAALTERVNEVFAEYGAEALSAKRREMEREGLAGHDRLELTVLFTERGIQPAFSIARARKESAPVPGKGLASRLFGWLIPGRSKPYTVEPLPARMPRTERATPTRTKRRSS